ncbi:MAG: hypothetical protein JWQ69_4739, partial [Pseudomonas sp.]|nr:hypothetical protein [Pseudomonas sp.]
GAVLIRASVLVFIFYNKYFLYKNILR